MSAQRVVSLIASATETVAALGCADRLVGRSHECDFPPEIMGLPPCSAAKVDIHAPGGEIDRQVKELLHAAVSIYELKTDVLNAVRPDLIITQSQCEVCAVSLRDVEKAVCELIVSQPKIVSLEPNGLADVWRTIQEVADALEVPERGHELITRSRNRLNAIAVKTRRFRERPTVACIEWIDPLMAGGNWVPELVGIAGGINLFGEAGKHSPWMTFGNLLAADPELIVILPCGWDIPRSRSEMSPLTTRPEWPHLRAVKNRRVYLTDGNQYFNRPGPRLVESAEILAEILHPETFHFGHEGTGWVPL